MSKKEHNKPGWFENPDHTGKAPKHQAVALRNKYAKDKKPSCVCIEPCNHKKSDMIDVDEIVDNTSRKEMAKELDEKVSECDTEEEESVEKVRFEPCVEYPGFRSIRVKENDKSDEEEESVEKVRFEPCVEYPGFRAIRVKEKKCLLKNLLIS